MASWIHSTSTSKIHYILIAPAQPVSRLHISGTHSPISHPGCQYGFVRPFQTASSSEYRNRHDTNSCSAYPLASLGYANWILRHYGYKTVFIFGLTLYGIGALCMWPAGLNQSFGGFCGATFVIGSGLGSLETAANPYLTGTYSPLFLFLLIGRRPALP